MVYTTVISPQVAARAPLGEPKSSSSSTRAPSCLSDFSHGKREYDAGHIPGAFFAAFEEDLAGAKTGKNGRHPVPEPEAFAGFLRSLRVHDATQIVAYDDGADMFAPRLWMLARWIGHDAVAVLDGGIKAWKALGYPVTTEVPARLGGGTLRVRMNEELLVDAAYVLANHTQSPEITCAGHDDAPRGTRSPDRTKRSTRSPDTFPVRTIAGLSGTSMRRAL